MYVFLVREKGQIEAQGSAHALVVIVFFFFFARTISMGGEQVARGECDNAVVGDGCRPFPFPERVTRIVVSYSRSQANIGVAPERNVAVTCKY